MSNKTFTIAGTSILKGELKVRFANDESRGKVLIKNGHEDVVLVALSTAMSKLDAARALLLIPEFAEHADRSACINQFIEDELEAQKPKAAKEPKAPKAAKAAKEPKVEIKPAQPNSQVETKPAEDSVIEPVPELPKTQDTVSEEEWAVLQAVSSDKA